MTFQPTRRSSGLTVATSRNFAHESSRCGSPRDGRCIARRRKIAVVFIVGGNAVNSRGLWTSQPGSTGGGRAFCKFFKTLLARSAKCAENKLTLLQRLQRESKESGMDSVLYSDWFCHFQVTSANMHTRGKKRLFKTTKTFTDSANLQSLYI